MAFGAKKIYPIDTKPGVAVGVNIPFNSPGVFSSSYTTQQAVKNNLINFFLTNKGERYLEPDFGGDLRRFVFEQISTNSADEIDVYIRQQMAQNFPNLIVDELTILSSYESNDIIINMVYSIANTGINDQLQLELT